MPSAYFGYCIVLIGNAGFVVNSSSIRNPLRRARRKAHYSAALKRTESHPSKPTEFNGDTSVNVNVALWMFSKCFQKVSSDKALGVGIAAIRRLSKSS